MIDVAKERALCVSEDLSTWPQDRLYGELYRLHRLVPQLLDALELSCAEHQHVCATRDDYYDSLMQAREAMLIRLTPHE